MLKRKIKIILIGLSSLLFLGLIYSLFSAKPEIIADENLRIEEPEMPGLRSQVDRAARADKVQSSTMSDSEVESSLESKLVDQPVASYREDLVSLSSQMPNKDSLGEDHPELAETSGAVVKGDEARTELSTTPAAQPKNNHPENFERMIAQSVSPFRDDAIGQRSGAVQKADVDDGDFLVFDKVKAATSEESSAAADGSQYETGSDVPIIPDASEFLDLNLSEVQSVQQNMVLVEGDQLIFDDVNQELRKHELVISKPTTSESEVSNDSFDPALTKAEVVVLSATNKADAYLSNAEILDKAGEEKSNAEEALVAARSSTKPSVFNLPNADRKLMQGDSEISKKYRQTMAKLISINAELRDVDAENVELQTQFDVAVSQNKLLAQIIRDIDTQIRAFTLTN